jgi:ABC-2 type transport system permease protein
MPIFDQGYQHWNGRLSGHLWRWLAITEQGVRQQLRRKGTKWTLITAFVPALALASALAIWGLLEQGSSLLDPIKPLLQGLPEELRDGPKGFRAPFWTMAFDLFFRIETFFVMIIVATVGPDLISQDLRYSAIPLYLSRPLRRVDYFLGKLGVIAFFLGAVVFAPAILAYALGLAFSFEFSVLHDTARVLLGTLAFGLVIILSAGMAMLAISSLSRNSRLVTAFWMGAWILSGQAAEVLDRTVRQDWCPVVSYTRNLGRVREGLLGTVAARDEFLSLADRARAAAGIAAREAARQSMPFGLGRRRRPLEPSDFNVEPGPAVKREPPQLLRLESDSWPWTWAASALAGLFVVSVVTLTTRVKSLDRLK